MKKLKQLAKLVRYYILISTTSAGSGHPTSSLSAVELMVSLMFSGIYHYNLDDPEYPNNDRLIFSKGHASPLLYSLYAAAGKVTEEKLLTLRKFTSSLEGHPTASFRYTELATGSLGQGLAMGVGMALNAKRFDKLPYRTYVLLGDSEMAEGSQWESLELAAYYQLNNLIGIIDVNRLGQRGETMYGYDLDAYQEKVVAFGWEAIVIDGHNIPEIINAYQRSLEVTDKPVMIIAKTVKGKGVSFVENKNGWHGKTLNQEQLEQALEELGEVDKDIVGDIDPPQALQPEVIEPVAVADIDYALGEKIATRKAFGNALVRLFPKYPRIVSLDAEVSNSTYAQLLKDKYPEHF
ncbi:MAG TPA: transketolase, partial [Actinobacteria bacterium]|nr:transketolase [Actinomycetes bacterium]HEX21490.1 transketolase [Actinomycetota bacterium]